MYKKHRSKELALYEDEINVFRDSMICCTKTKAEGKTSIFSVSTFVDLESTLLNCWQMCNTFEDTTIKKNRNERI